MYARPGFGGHCQLPSLVLDDDEAIAIVVAHEIVAFAYVDTHGETRSRRVEPHRRTARHPDAIRVEGAPDRWCCCLLCSRVGEDLDTVRITAHACIAVAADAFRHFYASWMPRSEVTIALDSWQRFLSALS